MDKLLLIKLKIKYILIIYSKLIVMNLHGSLNILEIII